MARDPVAIAVVIFDRAPMFETAVPMSVFGVDQSNSGVPKFRLLVVAGESGPLTTTGGLIVDAPFGLDALDEAAVIVLPSWRDGGERPPEAALTAIRAAHADGAIIVTFCMGGFVLAATGLLDRRRAVVHWRYAPKLAAMYPAISVDNETLFIDDGDIVTGAGTGAALDACLALVERLWGEKAATAIAQRMAMPPRRIGTRAQVIDTPSLVPTSSEKFSEIMAFAVEHIAEPFNVDELAHRARMSRRTFDRHFRDAAGMSAMQWLLQQRVFRAQQLIEERDEPIEDIARRAGFNNGVALRRYFHRYLGISPLQYRLRHKAEHDARGQTPSEGSVPDQPHEGGRKWPNSIDN
jgi:transcriptional regulator GlxA family with amidase domain